MGIRVYDDKHVQVTYINLRTLSKLISSLRIQAQIDLQDAINNVGVHAVKDQTLQILGMFASKIFEAFPTAAHCLIVGKFSCSLFLRINNKHNNTRVPSKVKCGVRLRQMQLFVHVN